MLAVNCLNLARTHYAYCITIYSIYLLFMICMLSLHLECFLECVCISLDTFFAYDVIYIVQICV